MNSNKFTLKRARIYCILIAQKRDGFPTSLYKLEVFAPATTQIIRRLNVLEPKLA